MKINKVTITGADDLIDPVDLLKLTDKYSFVEWGILFSKSKEGQLRYPSKQWIEVLLNYNLNLSAHFCGWWVKEVLERQNFRLITLLSDQFKRVQLNYNFKNSHGWNLIELLKYAEKHQEREIILQYNRSNAEVLYRFQSNGLPPNINFLYDGSGGTGKKIISIEPPLYKAYTGYSGGIDVDNIEHICSIISQVDDNGNVWIDLESGARTNNEFDLRKVESLLSKALIYGDVNENV
jgi:hypothetical protein